MNRIARLPRPEERDLPVAVVGAGFSGAMVAIHLANALPPERSILLCERGAPCRGAAYGTENAGHMLNVRAANMSAFPSQPDHFDRWLTKVQGNCPDQVLDTPAGRFAARGLYGGYLSGLLDAVVANHPNRVRLLCGEAVDIVPEGDRYRLVFADGAVRVVAGVVLAIGNLPPPPAASPLWRSNPWAPEALAGLRADRPVMVLGTGLTMVDLALDLRSRGFPGPVIAVSRRGLLPHWHAATRVWPTPDFTAAERISMRAMCRRVRDEVRRAEAVGVDWRSVIDSLRPITTELWRGLPLDERRRFLRHVRRYWDIHRSRLATPVADKLAEMLSEGYLALRRGRIVGIADGAADAVVTLQPPGGGPAERIAVQRIVDATGLHHAGAADSSLIGQLRRRGLIRLDDLGIGIDVTGDLRILDAAGAASRHLWALGPIVRGVFWECIAVPDIRVQAERLARQVAQALGAAAAAGRD